LVFVILPTYYQLKNIAQNNNKIIDFYKNIEKNSQIYFLGFPIIKETKEKKYFYNFSHLNAIGANTFTNTLTDSLSTILKNKS